VRDVFIAGTGMTAFGKFGDSTVRSLTEEATSDALRDAQASPGDVGMAFFANATAGILTGQEMIRGQVALRHTGLLGVPIVNVENACASASSAFYLAHLAVASGQVDIALAVGAETLTHADKRRTFAAIGTALDLDHHLAARQALTRTLLAAGSTDGADAASPAPFPADTGRPRSPFMDVYAGLSHRYMEQSGATREDLARVAVKNQRDGKLNPKAQYGGDVTVEEVLASRPADQLRGRGGARQVDGARVALAENAGGFLGPDLATVVVTVLTRT